ncbi:protein FAM171A1 [Protopterus annectens]|uniref:protein FAM171A1 n=1 Tax=Protopterus annectens TaxID=7888 RepID=UPI001CFB0FFB|nr:protein FAM171A1 [Protopterus annectens]
MRVATSGSAATHLLLCLLGCNVWKAVTKTLQDSTAQEVTLKVHVSDASTHQPVTEALIEVFADQTSIATQSSRNDGIVFIKFKYRLGSQLIVTANKHGYVPNSAPWRPTRLPVFSSLSLGLLPERAATLMVYEDVVQIVSGFQGFRAQPKIHFPRRALNLPINSSYNNLTVFLTVASSPWELDSFPYLQGVDGNGTGNGSKFELTPITAISVHLYNNDGTEILVNGPIYVTVPLPANINLKHDNHVPAWKFDQKLGAWLKSGLGLVQQEGNQLTWTYIAPQLGYWVAAMSPVYPGPVTKKDITTYHTFFLLAILGGMAIILLVLLCLLLYYCRRKCLKPRQHHRKLLHPSVLESSKKDQATSMSHINLISAVNMEIVSSSGEADIHTPMLKPSYSTSREFIYREELISQKDSHKSRTSIDNFSQRGTLQKEYHSSVEMFPLKMARSIEGHGGSGEYNRSYNSVTSRPLLETQDKEVQVSVNHISAESNYSLREKMYQMPCVTEKEPLERRPPDYMMSRSADHLERPTSFPYPGQLICYNSVDQVNENIYRKILPTLVIPAHYMKLPAEHPYMSQPLIVPAEESYETEQLQKPHQQQNQFVQHQDHLPQTSHTLSQQHLHNIDNTEWTLQNCSVPESLSIPASLSEAAVSQMNGDLQLFTEKTLIELNGGKPLPHPRAWFVSLDGRSNAQVRHSYIDLQRAGRNGSNDASLDSGVDMNELRLGRRGREQRFNVFQHPRLKQQQQTIHEPHFSDNTTYTQLVYLDDVDQSGSECGTAVCSPEDNSLMPLLDGDPSNNDMLPSSQERVLENEPKPSISPDHELPPPPSPPSPPHTHDDSDDQGEKKSPWQKREERPLIAFNIK